MLRKYNEYIKNDIDIFEDYSFTIDDNDVLPDEFLAMLAIILTPLQMLRFFEKNIQKKIPDRVLYSLLTNYNYK